MYRPAQKHWCTVLLFQPKYRLGHPEKYLFLLSKKICFCIKVSKKIVYVILKTGALLVQIVTQKRAYSISRDTDSLESKLGQLRLHTNRNEVCQALTRQRSVVVPQPYSEVEALGKSISGSYRTATASRIGSGAPQCFFFSRNIG